MPEQARSPPEPAQPKAKAPKALKLPSAEPSKEPSQPLQPLQRVALERRAEIEEQRARLPAVMMEQEFVEMVLSNDVMLVCGDTGCGKSTQARASLHLISSAELQQSFCAGASIPL